MAEFHASVRIDQSREKVFAYLVDPATQTVWQSGLQEFEADWKDDPKVGDRARGTVKVAGKKVHWETVTTEVQPPERITFRSLEAPFDYELSYTLIDHGASTEVRHDGSTGTLGGGFFGKLADPLVALMYQRDMESNLANLKSIIEES